jgi:hypothetical protein
VFMDAVLGYRRPAACNTELCYLQCWVLLLGSAACFQIWKKMKNNNKIGVMLTVGNRSSMLLPLRKIQKGFISP